MVRAAACVLALMAAGAAVAAEPVARASFGRRQLMVNEEVYYTITLSADRLPRNVALPQPDFADFDVISGPEMGSSQQVSIINGQVTQSVSRTYSWRLLPRKEGGLSVPPVQVDVGDGRTVSTGRAVVQVVSTQGALSTPPPAASEPQPRPRTDPRARAESSRAWEPPPRDKPVQMIAEADDTEAWLGQEITLSHVLRYTVDVQTYQMKTAPDFPGFANTPAENQRPDGHPVRDPDTGATRYFEAVLARWSLVPLATGEQVIPAQAYTMTISEDPFAGVFGRMGGGGFERQIAVATQPIRVTVKPLPPGAPPGFSGAVGSFRLDGAIDSPSVKAGDGLTLTLTVEGAGSFRSVLAPRLTVPPGLKSFDPEATEKAGLDASAKTQGSKTFRYPILATDAGRHEIPVVEWSFFDPRTARYVTRQAGPFAIEVTPGDASRMPAPVGPLTQATTQVERQGSDIRHLAPSLGGWRPDLGQQAAPRWTWLLVALGPAINLVLLALALVARRRVSDPAARRAQGALKRARARLREARSAVAARRGIEAADAIARAVGGLVSDRLQLGAELSPAEAGAALAEAGAPGIASEVERLLQDCDFARFASGAGASSAPQLLTRAEEIVTRLASARLLRQEAA